MKVSKLHAAAGAFALLAGTTGAVSAATITLDPFTTEQTASSPSTPFSTSPAPFAIGDNREFTVTSSSARPNATQLATSDGVLDFNNAARATGTGTIVWNGVGNGGLGGFDLTDGGSNDAVFLDVLFADANVDLSFSVTDTAGQTSSFDYLIDEVLEGELAFNYGDFIGEADFASIDTISLALTGLSPAADLTLDVIYFGASDPGTDTPAPVPLPASALLLGPGILALAAFKRRRRAA